MTKAKQVFISHATADAPFAHRLADDLRRLGVQVWIAPESIRPGESWVDAIERGLGESSHTVIVLTPKALKSRWVKKETGVAIAQERKGRIQVIPLDVEPCEVPLLLGSYQRVSFRYDYDAGISQLADILGLRFAPPEEEAMPFWRKVPLWGWGAVGGLVLLAVVGGVLLAGRGPKVTPTPASIVEVSTPVVSSLSMSHSPDKLLPGKEVRIWVNVSVANLKIPIVYTWSAEGGEIVRGQGTTNITYKAPDTPGAYGITLKVEYGNWDTERSAPIVVFSPMPTLTPLPPTGTPIPPTDTPLPPTPTDTPQPTPTSTPSPPPALYSGRIAFVTSLDGKGEIYVMNADGSEATRLTNNPADDRNPSWSPDGRRIAFQSDRDGNDEIYVMNADGTGLRRLTDGMEPAWSPDGRRIAFCSSLDGNREIYVMNSDGSEVTRLTNNPAWDYDPSWSPDGTRIALRSDREGNHEIYVMNADGSEVTRLTNNRTHDDTPSWSPDGKRIAFYSNPDGKRDIYVMNTDGSGLENLTNNPAGDYAPSWSPDGMRIVFQSDRDGNHEIYVMNADGSEVTRLTNNPAWDYAPSWGP